jgi:GGDEF domain-containing protein
VSSTRTAAKLQTSATFAITDEELSKGLRGLFCHQALGDFLIRGSTSTSLSVGATASVTTPRRCWIPWAGRSIAVTVSIGVCEFSPDLATFDEFLSFADNALYQAKKEGRARVVLWDGEHEMETGGFRRVSSVV